VHISPCITSFLFKYAADSQTQQLESLREVTAALSAHSSAGSGGVFRQSSAYMSTATGESSAGRGSARDGGELKKATQVSAIVCLCNMTLTCYFSIHCRLEPNWPWNLVSAVCLWLPEMLYLEVEIQQILV
jgi:hypothetical protein